MIGEALVKHLSCFGDLSPDDAEAIRSLKGDVRTLQRRRDILTRGDEPRFSVILLRGFLCRHSSRSNGARRIHSFYIPTDAPSLETLHLDYMDHGLGAVVDSRIGVVAHRDLYRLMDERPNVLALIWRQSLVQAAIFREWLTRNGSLPAHASMAHLFCEIYTRAKAAGLVIDNSCDMPVTQEMLGDALGLTAVHINRTLQLLRETGWVEHKQGRLIVHDFDRLASVADFDPHYLHLHC